MPHLNLICFILWYVLLIYIYTYTITCVFVYIYRIWHDPEAWLGDRAGGAKRRNFPWTKRHQAPTTCSEFCEIGGVEWKRSSFERPNVLIKNPRIKRVRGNPPKMTCVQDLEMKITCPNGCSRSLVWKASKDQAQNSWGIISTVDQWINKIRGKELNISLEDQQNSIVVFNLFLKQRTVQLHRL